MDGEADRLQAVELTEVERTLLSWGLWMWHGPATMTDRLARVLWFESADEFGRNRDRLEQSVCAGDPLSSLDWHRVLAAVEIGFCSWTLGAGGDWAIVTGIDDAESLSVLRGVQEKLAWVRPWPEPYARPRHTQEPD